METQSSWKVSEKFSNQEKRKVPCSKPGRSVEFFIVIVVYVLKKFQIISYYNHKVSESLVHTYRCPEELCNVQVKSDVRSKFEV